MKIKLFNDTRQVLTAMRIARKIRKKGEILPWDNVPETTTYTPLYNEIPPDWEAADYLKEVKGWVHPCVTAIADEVATIKLRLFKRTTKGVEEIFDHELLDLLYKVNDFTTKFDHFWSTQEYLELTGEAPWLLDIEKGKPVGMYLLRPDKLSIKFDKDKIIGSYIYKPNVKTKLVFEPEQVIFLKYPNPLKPFRGAGTLEAAVQTVNLDKYAEQWNVQFFYNAARPDAVLTTEKSLTDQQRERLKKMWKKNFQGISKRAKLAILEAGLDYKPMQMSQKDMDFLEQQRFSRDKILSIFRVPKTVVAISDDVNRANAEAGAYAFARWTIKPKMMRIVEQLNEFLVPMFGDDLFLSFDDPVPENVDMKIKKYNAALGVSGWMTINEVRKEEGLDPVDGGDSILRPMSSIPTAEAKVQKMLSLKVKKIKKTKEQIRAEKESRFHEQLKGLNARDRFKRKIKKIEEKIRKIIKSSLQKNNITKVIKKSLKRKNGTKQQKSRRDK